MPSSALTAILSVSLVACTSTAAVPERPPPTASRPLSVTPAPPQSVQLALGPQPLPTIDAISPEEVGEVFPDIAALPEQARWYAVGALNLVPAPCPPCQAEALSLARCAVAPPPGCENLSGLVARASRMAAGGAEVDAIREALSYADVWFAPAPGQQDPAAVDIEVWLDPASPFVALTLARVTEVQAAAGRTPLHWRWQAVPSAEHPALSQALARAAAQDKAQAWLEALQGTDEQAIQAADQRAGVSAEGPKGIVDEAAMRTKDVRSSPTWFVEGYRLRGLQSVRELGRVIALEQDVLETETP